jgi:hypothetical protein
MLAWSQVEHLALFYLLFAGIGFLQAATLYDRPSPRSPGALVQIARGAHTALTLWAAPRNLLVQLADQGQSILGYRPTVLANPIHLQLQRGVVSALPMQDHLDKTVVDAHDNLVQYRPQDSFARRCRCVAILAALAPLNPDQHPLRIDLADAQHDDLTAAQASAIGNAQRRLVFEPRAGRGLEQAGTSSGERMRGSFRG